MRLMILGAGGVGTSAGTIIKRQMDIANQDWAEIVVFADYDLEAAKKSAALCGDGIFKAAQCDAFSPESIKAVVDEYNIDFVMNACDPRMDFCIFDTCLDLKVGYLDCACTVSEPHPEKPYELTNVKLGDYQFAKQKEWEASGKIAVCGSGVEPGTIDVFAKYAAKHLFDKIDELNVRDGDNITGGDSAFAFSPWTCMEECLNPAFIWAKDEEHPDGWWYCTPPMSEPEIFNFPCGIGAVEVVNVEHEEVLLMPREIDCNKVTFKYGLDPDFRNSLFVLHNFGLDDKNRKIKVGDTEITPRDFVCKVVGNPTEGMYGLQGTCTAGVWVTGWKDDKYRSLYMYSKADAQECEEKFKTNIIVAQTAVGPVIMMELIAKGIWNEPGAWGPEHFDPDPFVEVMARYEFPAAIKEMDSEYCDMLNEQAALASLEANK
ncbi:MAG: saccharopine dehydrogenase NADP-binding domain-containing protein [Clostridia bacterium]|nr:saccharopine dehydrogenase NADP-binding domain-containing protein [Clostridia bacterium]